MITSLAEAKLAYRIPDGDISLKSKAKLGDDYHRMAVSIIQKQLAKAGTRIAWMLNEIFR